MVLIWVVPVRRWQRGQRCPRPRITHVSDTSLIWTVVNLIILLAYVLLVPIPIFTLGSEAVPGGFLVLLLLLHLLRANATTCVASLLPAVLAPVLPVIELLLEVLLVVSAAVLLVLLMLMLRRRLIVVLLMHRGRRRRVMTVTPLVLHQRGIVLLYHRRLLRRRRRIPTVRLIHSLGTVVPVENRRRLGA